MVTDLYTKPTDTHQYLHRSSCHPLHCKNSIAFSQALRLCRICCRPHDYDQRVEELKTYLVDRGYNEQVVLHQINKATQFQRKDLLTTRTKEKKEQVTPLVVTYHPDLSHLTYILHNHQCVLNTSPQLKGALPRPPLLPIATPPQP